VNIHGVIDVRQIEIHTVDKCVPKLKISTANLKKVYIARYGSNSGKVDTSRR
jgi:hypothetical protein